MTIAAIALAVALLPSCKRAAPSALHRLDLPCLQPGATSAPTRGPLRPFPPNPRYFADRDGTPVFLTGSHTWNNFQDWGRSDPPAEFDYPSYLDFLRTHGHNFIRLWVWEQAAWLPWERDLVHISPVPYSRTGPGKALDGKPRFDLHRFDEAYFMRLRNRVEQAARRGIYVSVMLFDGFSIEPKGKSQGNPWKGHPFNRENNVNGVDGDLNGDGEGREVHTLASKVITDAQERYLTKVNESIGDLDNVLWEISNESHSQATAWQYHMIRFVREYEAKRGSQHPVGMTAEWPKGSNADLLASPADWVAPKEPRPQPFDNGPSASDGEKVVFNDTDHIWGIGGTPGWVWTSVLRGRYPIFMDPYKSRILDNEPVLTEIIDTDSYHVEPIQPQWEAIRRMLGYAKCYAERVGFAAMIPRPDLASTGYCMAVPGSRYFVFLPAKPASRSERIRTAMFAARPETVTVDLSAVTGRVRSEWFDPGTGHIVPGPVTEGGGARRFTAPFHGDSVLFLLLQDHPTEIDPSAQAPETSASRARM